MGEILDTLVPPAGISALERTPVGLSYEEYKSSVDNKSMLSGGKQWISSLIYRAYWWQIR
jgi:hypothetical protein